MSNYICSCCGRKYDIEQSGDYQCECGNEFHFEVKTQPVPTEQICPFCKSTIPADALKCAHCGEWLSGKSSQSKTLYIVLGILFGPIAEFTIGNYFIGVLFSLFYYGSVALWIASSGSRGSEIAALIAAAFAFLYWINVFTTKVGAEKEIYIQQQKGKKTSIMFPLVFAIILILAVVAVACYALFFQQH